MLAALLGATSAVCAEETDGANLLRLAISEDLIGDVNPADARAAMSVWTRRIWQDLRLDLKVSDQVFENSERLVSRVRRGELDTVAITIFEYRRLAEFLDPHEITIPSQKAKLGYVLLVKADAGMTRVSDLRGKRVLLLNTPATMLGRHWLASLLATEEPAGPERFFSSMDTDTKPARVMLPVFFGRADACLATSFSFATMSELNPQVGQRLKVLASSPEMVTTMYAYRKNWNGRARQVLTRIFGELRNSPSGQQILTLFQCEQLESRDISCLNNALQVLAQAEKLERAKRARGAAP